MIVFPAIDMRQGRCVRLLQGKAEHETVYFKDPVAVAQRWQDEGAEWLHLVDLDGAMSSAGQNRVIALKIFRSLKIPVQFGGGVRTMRDVRELLEAGASRLIVGTAAVEDPAFLSEALSEAGSSVAVGVDAREGKVATRGWNQLEQLDALDFVQELAGRGVQRIVFTDISKDGMLAGPNLVSTRQVAAKSGIKIIASGGVSSLGDLESIKELESLGVEGVIVGKALYERRFSLREALKSVK